MKPFPQGCVVTLGGVVTDASIVEYNDEKAVAQREKEQALNYLITTESIAKSKESLIMTSTVLQGIKTELEYVCVPEGINTVNPNCLKGTKSKVRLISLPESLTRIGKDTFKELSELEEVRFSEDLTHIGASAFANCPKLKTVKFPYTMEKIDASAFKGCKSLTKVILPKKCAYTKDNKYLNSFPETCEVVFE